MAAGIQPATVPHTSGSANGSWLPDVRLAARNEQSPFRFERTHDEAVRPRTRRAKEQALMTEIQS